MAQERYWSKEQSSAGVEDHRRAQYQQAVDPRGLRGLPEAPRCGHARRLLTTLAGAVHAAKQLGRAAASKPSTPRHRRDPHVGQSLEYDWDLGAITVPNAASFREVVGAMSELIKEGSRRCRYRQFKGDCRVDGVPHRQNQRLRRLQRQRRGSHGSRASAEVIASASTPSTLIAHRHVRRRARIGRAGTVVYAERLLHCE